MLDADMTIRKAIDPIALGAARGKPVGADYEYLVGCYNELVHRHVPEHVEYCQQVGGIIVMHRDDLRAVAPRWLHFTEQVRHDPEAWRLSGDSFVTKGGKPWISEMYGYAFACAEAHLEHQVNNDYMLYPGKHKL